MKLSKTTLFPQSLCLAAATQLLCVSAAVGQATRESLIREAFTAAVTDSALSLVIQGVNPNRGPADSLWAQGVQLLVESLIELEDTSLAETWMRWAVRSAPTTRFDDPSFNSAVAEIYERARLFVGADTHDQVGERTSWNWAVSGVSAGSGRIRLDIRQRDARLFLDSTEITGSSSFLEVQPGSHLVRVEAPGFLSAEIIREVMPGVTAIVEVTLVSEEVAARLTSDVRERAEVGIRPILSYRMRDLGCEVGVRVTDELVVTTYAAIRGADSLRMELPNGSAREAVTVLAYDVEQDFAVLGLVESGGPLVPVHAGSAIPLFGWLMGHSVCAKEPTRVRLTPATATGRTVRLDDEVASGSGGPVIDWRGSLVGLAVGSGHIVSVDSLEQLIALAQRRRDAGDAASVGEVAVIENHRYGAISLSANQPDVVAVVSPTEAWHWPGLAQSDSLPFVFPGPRGDYRVQVFVDGMLRADSVVTINPGTATPFAFVDQDSGQLAASGGFPWSLAGIAGAGAATAFVVLFLLPEDDVGPVAGGIIVTIPNSK